MISAFETTLLKTKNGSIAFLSLIALVGVVYAGSFIPSILSSLNARRWPTVNGIVLHARIATERRRTGHNYHTAYLPEVRYRYVVNGRDYESSRIGYDLYESLSPDGDAFDIVAKYSDEVTVYFNPANPGDATLETTIPRFSVVNSLAGLGVLCAATALMYGLMSGKYASISDWFWGNSRSA